MKKIGVDIIKKIANRVRNGKSLHSEEKHGRSRINETSKTANAHKKNNSFKWLTKSSLTIRFKLITSFMVPIAFIILLGIVSFKVASEGIVKNYEKSTLQTINMTGKYLQFGLNSVEASSIQYGNDDTITKYMQG